MREIELREHAKCSICNNLIGSTGLPLFWVVKVERHGIRMGAICRQDGLAALLNGNSYLAQVMGADEEMTQSLMGPITLTVCEACAMENIFVEKALVLAEEN